MLFFINITGVPEMGSLTRFPLSTRSVKRSVVPNAEISTSHFLTELTEEIILTIIVVMPDARARTKNGALFGEALVIKNPAMDDHFRWMMKRQNGLLAKGRLIGVQFEALLEGGEDSLYYEIGRHSNEMADMLREGLKEMGVEFFGNSPTNQVFPILPENVVKELEKDFFFYEWAPPENGKITIRLVTGWGTEEGDVKAFLEAAEKLLK